MNLAIWVGILAAAVAVMVLVCSEKPEMAVETAEEE